MKVASLWSVLPSATNDAVACHVWKTMGRCHLITVPGFDKESTVLTSAMRSDEVATKVKYWFGLVSAVFDRCPVRLLKTDVLLRIFAGLASSHRAM